MLYSTFLPFRARGRFSFPKTPYMIMLSVISLNVHSLLCLWPGYHMTSIVMLVRLVSQNKSTCSSCVLFHTDPQVSMISLISALSSSLHLYYYYHVAEIYIALNVCQCYFQLTFTYINSFKQRKASIISVRWRDGWKSWIYLNCCTTEDTGWAGTN